MKGKTAGFTAVSSPIIHAASQYKWLGLKFGEVHMHTP